MKSIKRNKEQKIKNYSIFKYMILFLSYIFGIFPKKHSEYLESSKYLIKSSKRKNLRRPLVFPIKNPNQAIKNEISYYGRNRLKKSSFKEEKKKYLSRLSKKKQEDYAHNLRKYNRWKIYWPFYFIWIKFIRLFNLDFIFAKDSRYEFSNDQLEIFNEKQKKYRALLDKIIILKWFVKYYHYLREKIQTKKYQRNNWIVFAVFTLIYIICFSILISYAAYVINGKITYPAFSNGISYPNFFFDKLSLANAILDLSVVSLIFMLFPVILLISLLFSNINDASYNIIFVYSQQLIYLLVGIFLLSSVSMELTLFYAH